MNRSNYESVLDRMQLQDGTLWPVPICLDISAAAAVYGEPTEIPITEAHACRPSNPFGNSKLAAEHLLCDYAAAHGLRYMALRYFNAAGADDSGEIGELHDPEDEEGEGYVMRREACRCRAAGLKYYIWYG